MTRRAGVRDTVRVVGGVITPTIAGGVIRRRPHMLAWLDRLQLDRTAVRVCEDLRARYGPGPVWLRVPGRSIALLLDPDDVDRVLTSTPSPFSPAAREKERAEPLRATRGVGDSRVGTGTAPPVQRASAGKRPSGALPGRTRPRDVGEETRLLLTTTTSWTGATTPGVVAHRPPGPR